jgi:uncharacterized sulfatase
MGKTKVNSTSRNTSKVIVIMTDTQRVDMLGCYAETGLKTPKLDKLAAEGMRFDKAYTCSPVCAPARSAIFTGIWPHANGVWANELPLGNTIKTIGERLSKHKIHCAYIGKWHLDGHDYFGNGICPEGWDKNYWYDMKCYLDELSPEERIQSRKPGRDKVGIKQEFTFANRCSDRALDFLSKYHDESFFLVVSYDEPHGPYLCPKKYTDEYADYCFPKKRNVWDTLENKPEHQRVWAGERISENKDELIIRKSEYFGCNTFVDSEIGRVVDAINKHAPEAMVIYTSDHGDMLASHSLSNKGPAAYEENVRIPFIVRWPGIVKKGGICTTPVSHIDIVPTILDVMGVEIPQTLDGKSMRNLLLNPASELKNNIYIEFARYGNINDGAGGLQLLRSIYDGRYKLCVNLLSSDELYDLENDPDEIHNRIHDLNLEKVRDRLHDELLDWMNRTRDPFRGYYWERRPWRKDAHEASWAYTNKRRYKAMDVGEPTQRDYQTGMPIPKGRGHYIALG